MEWLVFSIIFFILVVLPLVIVYLIQIYSLEEKRAISEEIDKKNMVSVSPVKLPFSVDVSNDGENQDGISILIKGEKKCNVTYYVCVSANELQKAVEEKKFNDDRKFVDVLNLISYWISEPYPIYFNEDGSSIQNYSFTSIPADARERLEDAFNASSQTPHYLPIVACVQVHPGEYEDLVDDNNIVSIVSTIRSRSSCLDSPNTSRSSITSQGNSYAISEQYIEVLDGRVFLLKKFRKNLFVKRSLEEQLRKLYKSGVEAIDDEDTPPQHGPSTHPNPRDNEPTEYCLVCQEYPVTRALLPCRHVCTCKRCYSKLDALCPICRAPITSYFAIRPENDIPQEVIDEAVRHEDEDDISSFIRNEGIWAFIKSIWNAS